MKVTLGTLKDKGADLATFLEPRVGTKPSLSGGEIEIEDKELKEGVKPRQVKTYIKRFLYMNGVRKNYRVFVAGKELTIQEIVTGEKEKEEAEKKPEKKAELPPPQQAKAEPEQGAAEEQTEEQKAPKPKKAASKKPRPKKKKADDED